MKARLPALVLLLIAAVYGVQVLQIVVPSADAHEVMTPRTLPAILAMALGLIGVLLLLRPSAPSSPSDVVMSNSRLAWLRAAGLLGLGLLFAALIDPLGILVASTLILAAALYLMGVRRAVVLLGVSLGFSAALWLLLVVALGLYLHPGDLWMAYV